MRALHLLVPLLALPLFAASACDEDRELGRPDPGALIDVTFKSQVGVLLDELPAAARERVAADLLARPPEFWKARAERQIQMMQRKLLARGTTALPDFATEDDPEGEPGASKEKRAQLPLPPKEVWVITLGAPQRAVVDGHDVVTVSFDFASTLLTRESQPDKADPVLAHEGGEITESITLPIDPDLLVERTGYACINERGLAPNNVDSRGAHAFFDDTCTPGLSNDGCHVTDPAPSVSCIEALAGAVGTSHVDITFTRAGWSEARANEVRVGEVVDGGAQLAAKVTALEDNRVVHRYFAADSCAVTSGCVGGPGWRRLLMFSTAVHNVGSEDAFVGDVTPTGESFKNRLVSDATCAGEVQFNHWAKFTFGASGEILGSRVNTCIDSTVRHLNTEKTAITHPYTCEFQGTAAGWGTDDFAGLDCQWVDITPLNTDPLGLTAQLTFTVNPDQLLCEGELVTDPDGGPQYEGTNFTNAAGENESALECRTRDDAANDNRVTQAVSVPARGGSVTTPCADLQVGEKRDCDFANLGIPRACVPGEQVAMTCTGATADNPAVVRVCESSTLLGALSCKYRDALGTGVVAGTAPTITYTCPAARDATEVGGLANLLIAPVVPGDDVSGVICSVF